MKQRNVILTIAGIGFVFLTGLVLLFSPLTSQLLKPGSNNDWLEDVFGLFVFIFMLYGTAVFGITSIIACCQLGKRLGYDPYAGLLLLIPGINVFVFFYWAFKESPNERKMRVFRGGKSS